MFINKILASTLLLCSVFLTLSACGGGHGVASAHIDEFTVEPSTIPAPTAGNPVQFKVSVRVRAENNSDIDLATPVGSNPINQFFPIEKTHCATCEDELIEIRCTSSVSPTDQHSRLLSCPSTAGLYAHTATYPGALPHLIGTTEWGVLLTPNSAKGGKGANLLAKTVWRTAPVTVQ